MPAHLVINQVIHVLLSMIINEARDLHQKLTYDFEHKTTKRNTSQLGFVHIRINIACYVSVSCWVGAQPCNNWTIKKDININDIQSSG